MKHFRVILIIGVIEVLIGTIAISSNTLSIIFSTNIKPPSVLVFVYVASSISILIGVGILRLNRHAYRLLLYFSEFIILSKILILLNVFELSGGLQSVFPSSISSFISIAYHGYVICYLKRRKIHQIFHWR